MDEEESKAPEKPPMVLVGKGGIAIEAQEILKVISHGDRTET